MRDKVQYQVKATSQSYVFQLRGKILILLSVHYSLTLVSFPIANLDLMKSHLHQKLQNSQIECQQQITSLSHQLETFTALQNRLKKVRCVL